MRLAAFRTKPAVTPFARAVAVLALLVGVTIAGTGAAEAADGDAAWAVRTASNSLGAERTSFSYSLDPGGRLDDALVVANHGAGALELSVYGSDGYTTDAGQFDLLTTDRPSVGIGAWLRTADGSVTIQPGETVEVPFTVRIPANAPPGDYAGGIVTSLTQEDVSQGINVDRRLGIRVDLRVGGELAPAMTVDEVRLDYDGSLNPFATGDATVTYTIHNTGNAILSAGQSVSVAGPFGWWSADAGPLDAPPQLLPGESWTMSVPVHGVVPAFRLAATASVTPLLTDISGSTSPLAPVLGTAQGWAVPWVLSALVVLVAGAVAWTLVAARRRRKRRAAREDQRVQEAVEQALRERQALEAGR